MNWIAASEKDTATLDRFHPGMPPKAINTAIDKLTRDHLAMDTDNSTVYRMVGSVQARA